jgi:hypothetical protein
VRVLETSSNLDLAEEAVGAQGRREFGVEHFERDLPGMLQILSQKNRGHSATSHFSLNGVMVCQGGAETIGKGSHSGGNLPWNAGSD